MISRPAGRTQPLVTVGKHHAPPQLGRIDESGWVSRRDTFRAIHVGPLAEGERWPQSHQSDEACSPSLA
jgi:hypothetical protein